PAPAPAARSARLRLHSQGSLTFSTVTQAALGPFLWIVRPRTFWRACLRRITQRQLALVSSAETSFEALAIARVKSLPSGGKLGRRNWRLRSPRDRQFHSAPGTSGEGNAGPTHDVLLPANAET